MSLHISRLVAHLKWADAQVLEALRTTPAPNERALSLYAHVLGAEEVWLARIQGRRPHVAVWPTLSLDEATVLASRNAAELDMLVAATAPDDLPREIAYRNSAGQPFSSTLEDILLHVALHGAYHRGQIALLVRDAGGEPAPTDFIAYVRGAAAATRGPSATNP